LRVFKYHRKFSFLKYRIFCPKNFFFKKVNATSFHGLENFMGYSNQKAEKKFFKPFGSYIDFSKVVKKSEKSKYLRKNIELHGL
jgi:hypothetical protein